MLLTIVKFLRKPWMVMIVWQVMFFGGIIIGSTGDLKSWNPVQFIVAAIWFGLFVIWGVGMSNKLWTDFKYR